MADPSQTDLIALLARYGTDGILEAPQVLSAIRAMSGEQAGPDPGAAALLEELARHRDAAQVPMPAIDALISHVKQLRLSAAERFYQQHGQAHVDLTEFETLLGDLPLKEALAAVAEDSPNRVLESAIAVARDRRFLSTRRDLVPTAAAELDRRFDEVAIEAFGVLEHAGRRLTLEVINDLRRQSQADFSLRLDDEKGSAVRDLGFHLDPLYHVHWNNLTEPIRYLVQVPEGFTVTQRRGEGPKVKQPADIDPREFLLDIERDLSSQERFLRRHRHIQDDTQLVGTVDYFACNDEEGWCVAISQEYAITLEPDPDGGRRFLRWQFLFQSQVSTMTG